MKSNDNSIVRTPSKLMVEHLNLKLKDEGSCLRYVEKYTDANTIAYELKVYDKYIDNEYGMNLNISKEFETMVRAFFKGYGVDNTGFSNTVATIFADIEI